MAIYHMQAKVVSRGSGRSAVAASAYMSCSRMYNDYDGIQHDYTRKQGLIYQEVMLPPMAPSKWIDREQLWNAVEKTEKTKDSRLAREFVVALPVELDKDSNISLLQDFIKKRRRRVNRNWRRNCNTTWKNRCSFKTRIISNGNK